jgi:dUTP pyrophosphatase
MNIKVVLDSGAKMPDRAHPTDAGMDLFAMEGGKISPCGSAIFDTGVHVAIPEGYVGLLTSKSGLMSKQGITSRGTIDAHYTGSIKAVLFNHSHLWVNIEKGQKITQLVILPIITPELELVDSLEETERGTGGFGSTGAF